MLVASHCGSSCHAANLYSVWTLHTNTCHRLLHTHNDYNAVRMHTDTAMADLYDAIIMHRVH